MPRIKNKPMYNEQQKQEYIEYDSLNAQCIRFYFERIGEIELLYQKDIADMSVKELVTTLSSLNVRTISSRRHLISIVKGYIEWAIHNRKTNNDNKIENIKPDDIGSQYAITTQMLKSPEQVEEILNVAYVKGYSDKENRAVRDKLIYWLLYSGMTIEELELLKKTDIDYEKKTIISPIFENIAYDIDDNIMSLWEKCCKITHIEKIHGGSYSIANCKLVESDYLFRPVAGQTVEEKSFGKGSIVPIIYKIYNIYFEETGNYIKVSPINIKISGIYYKLYLLEKEGTKITSNIIIKYFNITGYKTKKVLLAKVRKYVVDYANWKEGFGYTS